MDDLRSLLEEQVPFNNDLVLYLFQCNDKSTREITNQHLLVAVAARKVIYAAEAFVHASKSLTTIYVAKVDTTGCHDRSARSPVSGITVAFLLYLMQTQSGVVRLSLFARSQPQYLFPCSSQNKDKHVLCDRALVRWWVSIFERVRQISGPSREARGYLLIPGFEQPELRKYLPESTAWSIGHPYQNNLLASDEIPKFPDDPKARFLDDLSTNKESDRTTVSQFWAQMAFRQEMSCGHVIGFISLEYVQQTENETSPAEVTSYFIDKKIYDAVYSCLRDQTYSTSEETETATTKWLHSLKSVMVASNSIQIRGQKADPIALEDEHQKSASVINELKPRKKRKVDHKTHA